MRELEVQSRISQNFLIPVSNQIMLLKPDSRLEKMVGEMRKLGYMPRLHSTETADETSGSIGGLLSTQELHQILALLKAYELSDGVHGNLTKYLAIMDGNLPQGLRREMAVIDDTLIDIAASKLYEFNKQYSKK
jgi:hypothetical protein